MSSWIEGSRQTLAGDWAARPTSRVTLPGGKTAILIETTPDDDPKTLQGHKIADFVRIAEFLISNGLHAPEIYEALPDQGILLVEDFGDASWARVLPNDEAIFYDAAIDLLKQLQAVKQTASFDLPLFTNSYIFGRTVWYLSEYKGDQDPSKRRAFIQAWDALMQQAHHGGLHFVHGDFHPGNLMRLADNRIGLLDFGGASWGNGHYDLVNLLEDIRRDVPDDIKKAAKTAYGVDEDIYAIFHAQFYMRLLGQMTKRGMAIPKKIPLALDGLIHRHSVLDPLKTLVFNA